jgi:hypothetical protein
MLVTILYKTLLIFQRGFYFFDAHISVSTKLKLVLSAVRENYDCDTWYLIKRFWRVTDFCLTKASLKSQLQSGYLQTMLRAMVKILARLLNLCETSLD